MIVATMTMIMVLLLMPVMPMISNDHRAAEQGETGLKPLKSHRFFNVYLIGLTLLSG